MAKKHIMFPPQGYTKSPQWIMVDSIKQGDSGVLVILDGQFFGYYNELEAHGWIFDTIDLPKNPR